jgi:hypothetical protein
VMRSGVGLLPKIGKLRPYYLHRVGRTMLLKSKLKKDRSNILGNLGGGDTAGNEFGVSGAGCNKILEFRPVDNSTSSQHESIFSGRAMVGYVIDICSINITNQLGHKRDSQEEVREQRQILGYIQGVETGQSQITRTQFPS